MLVTKCEHPNLRNTSRGREIWTYCPDCGFESLSKDGVLYTRMPNCAIVEKVIETGSQKEGVRNGN